MKYFVLVVLLGYWQYPLAARDQRYENLNNPTEYVFPVSAGKIVAIFKEKHGPNSWGPLGAGFRSDVYGLGIYDYYTKRYWTGRQEQRDEVEPPEAGRIGTIQATFEVHLVQKSERQTLVRVTVKSFEQQIGRRYRILPHFRKAPVIVEVKSDTYFEYLFLLKLGELLGEKNMPPIRGG